MKKLGVFYSVCDEINGVTSILNNVTSIQASIRNLVVNFPYFLYYIYAYLIFRLIWYLMKKSVFFNLYATNKWSNIHFKYDNDVW